MGSLPENENILTIPHLHRRVSALEEHAKGIDSWRVSIEENTAIQLEVVEVGKAIVKGMGWVRSIIIWIGMIAAAVSATVVAIKKTAELL